MDSLSFDEVQPDKGELDQPDEQRLRDTAADWRARRPRDCRTASKAKAIFKLFSLGDSSNRDEWATDFDEKALAKKVEHFIGYYTKEKQRWQAFCDGRSFPTADERSRQLANFVDREIKWTSELEAYLDKRGELEFDARFIRPYSYRPFVSMYTCFRPVIHSSLGHAREHFPRACQRRKSVIVLYR